MSYDWVTRTLQDAVRTWQWQDCYVADQIHSRSQMIAPLNPTCPNGCEGYVGCDPETEAFLT